jgi:hypothetical protein
MQNWWRHISSHPHTLMARIEMTRNLFESRKNRCHKLKNERITRFLLQISFIRALWDCVKSVEVSEHESGPMTDPAKNNGQFWNSLLAVLNLRVLLSAALMLCKLLKVTELL